MGPTETTIDAPEPPRGPAVMPRPSADPQEAEGPGRVESAEGFRAHWKRIGLLGVLAAFTGCMVGLERALLPLIAKTDFGILSATLGLSFLITFGATKAFANLGAGRLADLYGRRTILILGWLTAVPGPIIIIFAPSWAWVVVANAFLGVNQGLAWSMALNMKIDLAGPARRGLAIGVNESVGYTGVAVAAYLSTWLAAAYGLRPIPFVVGVGLALGGLTLALLTKETMPTTGDPVRRPVKPFALPRGLLRDPRLSTASFAGFANNLKDGLLWGLLPLLLLDRGVSLTGIGFVVALYPFSWAVAQLGFGFLSDLLGRRALIVLGFLTQGLGLALLVAAPAYASTVVAAIVLGLGVGMVYPTLIAYVADGVATSVRATAIGVYRFVRDFGYVGGALVGGVVSDLLGVHWALLSGTLFLGAAGAMVALRGTVTAGASLPTRVPPLAGGEP
ncbi:MAG: MFS transporter [Euryarchaeota archaeon]|nr:MFS transporter [Euryarchaeota archaeon]